MEKDPHFFLFSNRPAFGLWIPTGLDAYDLLAGRADLTAIVHQVHPVPPFTPAGRFDLIANLLKLSVVEPEDCVKC